MPGPNLTGIPTANDLVFGRGEVYAALLDANDLPSGGYTHLGNCPDFSQGVKTETAEHFSSMNGLKTRDLLVILQEQATLNFVLEECNEFNVAAFLKGTVATITNPAVAGFSIINQAYTAVALGRWFDVVTAAGVNAYNLDHTKLVLHKHAGSVLLVEGTDYTVDPIWGRFMLLAGAANIAAGDDVDVTLTADGANVVTTYRRIQALTSVGQKYAVLFVFKDAAHGSKQLKVQYNKVSLEPNGDMAMITTNKDVVQIKFACSCEASTAARYAASPTVSVDWHSKS